MPHDVHELFGHARVTFAIDSMLSNVYTTMGKLICGTYVLHTGIVLNKRSLCVDPGALTNTLVVSGSPAEQYKGFSAIFAHCLPIITNLVENILSERAGVRLFVQERLFSIIQYSIEIM